MSIVSQWTPIPTKWIQYDRGLHRFKWSGGPDNDNAGQIAALMLLIVIAHHTNKETGLARLSYDDMMEATGVSRPLVARGLCILEAQGLIARDPNQKRGTITLVDATESSGWGKMPAKGLYQNGRILAFEAFSLRNRAALDALKLYFLLIAFRNNKTNRAHLSYDKINEHSGIHRNRIRIAISLLAANSLVNVNDVFSGVSEYGISNVFQISHLKDTSQNLQELLVAQRSSLDAA